MELNVNMSITDRPVDFIEIQKLYFIHNAIDAGWSVKKRHDKYFFTKKHENKKEVYLDTYLQKFIEANLNQSKTTD